ncbi:MAG: response regulator transcription factor [Pseudooceanicola sp.]|nr:response regulator transcription factor [Pseudooceanicola sp.]
MEDETELREEISEELSGAGYRVVTAGDSQSGADLVSCCVPDLILCDVMIPGQNGFELISDLRASGTLAEHTAVIFLTALSGREHRLMGLACSADDYLTKPIDLDILHLTIRNKLERAFKYRDALGAWSSGPDIHLSPREEQVLERIGRGDTTTAIAFELGISDHTVNQYIKGLYRKLDVNNRAEATKIALGRQISRRLAPPAKNSAGKPER